MKNKIIIIIFYCLGAAVITALIIIKISQSQQPRVCFQNSCFNVTLALTAKEQAKGLMFRTQLRKEEGMLFVFKEEKKYPFWMKNTLIPLDIIWIDKNKKVVFIDKNIQPCKKIHCQVFTPDKIAKYVLELNAGTADRIGLRVGSKLFLNY